MKRAGVLLTLLAAGLAGCSGASADSTADPPSDPPVDPAAESSAGVPSEQREAEPARARQATWNQADWDIFASHIREAEEWRLDSKPAGEAIAALARSFVGTPYTPGTLEADGPEGLVINFRTFDCVTFVENVLAMTRFIRESGSDPLWDRAEAEARYERYLADLRYRGGEVDGYPSRLHYFSEWFTDNAGMGLVRTVTSEMDPATDSEPIDFMSTHPDAYRQLADPAVLAAIIEMEERLNASGARDYVPQDRIEGVDDLIQTGDVIAATSTVEGLDIAHTGIAVRIDGRLHLIHAPLVGSHVEISEVPLADRIRSISSQDGVMVARWAER